MSVPREDPHIALCVAGTRLTEAQARAAEGELGREPNDLATRLRLIGYLTRTGRHADDHILWLVRAHPEVRIGLFWTVHDESRDEALRLWSTKLRASTDSWICANAAWSTASIDPDFAERAYATGDHLQPRDPEWHCAKAIFFETSRDRAADNPSEQARLARRALLALLAAIECEPDRAHQLALIWPARRYAHDAGAKEELALLQAADREAKRAQSVPVQARPDEHACLTALGLVALANGDTRTAEFRLIESAKAVRPATQPSFSLARSLYALGAVETVIEFLEALRVSLPELGESISTWIAEARAGSTPRFEVPSMQ